MTLALKVVTADGEEVAGPFLLRIPGWTEERYFREAPETRFVEYEDGELIVHSPVGVRHQRLVLFPTMLLQMFVRHRRLGEVLNGPAVVRFRPGLDYEPDIFFVPVGQLAALGEDYFGGIPGLIVEVLSEGTRAHDLKTKAAAYRLHGVPEYWAVDLARRAVTVHLLPAHAEQPYGITEKTEGRLESAAISGFWIDVSWLWQDPLPDPLYCLDQIFST